VDLGLPHDAAARYKSPVQRIRVITEAWAERELYCLACQSDRLAAYPPGTRVSDFYCPRCRQNYQLKAKAGRFGYSVTNSAWQAKMDAIRTGTVPNYVFLGYDRQAWRVETGFVVPGHFITPSVILRRTPLRATARRAGWVGSKILLGEVPPDGRVDIVALGTVRPPAEARAQWSRFAFLKEAAPATRGWIGDVLRLIRSLGRTEFHLRDLYAQSTELRGLHPGNNNVEAKIRQQVQLLRDRRVLQPLGRGRYAIKNNS
jgi:type II restriction enzyme